MMTLTSTQIGQLVAQFFLAGAGTLSFAVLFACPKRTLPCCALVGAVGWFVYELAVLYGADAAAASLIAVIPLTLVSRLFAILLKTPVTVFLLTGIWHGANWTFLLWGVINGVFVVAERYVRNKKWYQRIPSVVKWAFTMAVVYFVWIMFMASDVSDAFSTYAALFAASPAVNFTWRYFLTRKLAVLLVIAALGSVAGALPMSEERRKRLWAPAPSGP